MIENYFTFNRYVLICYEHMIKNKNILPQTIHMVLFSLNIFYYEIKHTHMNIDHTNIAIDLYHTSGSSPYEKEQNINNAIIDNYIQCTDILKMLKISEYNTQK